MNGMNGKVLVGLVLFAVWVGLVVGNVQGAADLIFTIKAALSGLGALYLKDSPGVQTGNVPVAETAGPGKQAGYVQIHLLLCMSLLMGLCVTLAGCGTLAGPATPIGKFTLQDAQAASALALKNKDARGQACYDYIAGTLQDSGGPAFTPGLLYLNEVRRTAATATESLASACGGVLPVVVAP